VAALGTENCGNRDANGLGEALEASGPSVRAAVRCYRRTCGPASVPTSAAMALRALRVSLWVVSLIAVPRSLAHLGGHQPTTSQSQGAGLVRGLMTSGMCQAWLLGHSRWSPNRPGDWAIRFLRGKAATLAAEPVDDQQPYILEIHQIQSQQAITDQSLDQSGGVDLDPSHLRHLAA